jgi:hypothetical protein
MKRFAWKRAALFALLSMSVAAPASASWIRYLVLEHTGQAGAPIELKQQTLAGGGVWYENDPNVGQFFGNYVDNFSVIASGPGRLSFGFDLYKDPNDPSLTEYAIADTGAYNFYERGTNVLAAYLTISQSLAHVTVDYLSTSSGSALLPIIGGVHVDGVLSAFAARNAYGYPICDSITCTESRVGNIFPLGLLIEVARVPEPMTVPMVAAALGVMALLRRRRK